MKRPLLVAALALLGGSLLLIAIDACTIVNGLTVPEDAATAADVAPDVDVDSAPVDPCAHARIPPPPSTPDLPVEQTIVVVARHFGVATADGGPPAGFDLDNAC